MAPVNLSDLDAFTAVARARSFRGAASLRNVSASSLSEALKRLEADLGVRLLNRTTRSVTPTEAGERLLQQLTPALSDIEGALTAAKSQRDRPAGTLRLNVPEIVAEKILPAIVARFLVAHPGIRMEIAANNTFIDVVAEGFDAGIRYEEKLERDMIAIPIGPRTQRYVAAASPNYLAAHGTPRHPRELVNHACIGHRFASGRSSVWEFERGGRAVKISPAGPLIGSNIELELAAAAAGLGIVYSFAEFVGPEIERGALTEILADWSISFPGPYLYFPSRRHMPAPLRAFVDFVKNEPPA
ncbi:MAG: LysR family transcriptional regulator [Pseudolabrys sp.]|nr:LysR family transcriptional regulator [Pseudolabrys sp.]